MVDQLNSFASEVTRVAREVVRTDRRLAARPRCQASPAPKGSRPDNVNSMAGNRTWRRCGNIAEGGTAIAGIDLSKKITVTVSGEILAEGNHQHDGGPAQRLRSRSTRVARLGTEGRLGGNELKCKAAGTWKDLDRQQHPM